MTDEEFYVELEKLPARGWKVELCSPISALRVAYIRLVPSWITTAGTDEAWPDEYHYHCPITAVCLSVRRQLFHPREYKHAADLLRLREQFTERAIRAADGHSHHDPDTRTRLLTALGLVECRGES